MDTARLLRAVRRSRRLSQRELAAYAAVPNSTIDRIEAGTVEPKIGTFAAILRSVGYDLALVDQWGHILEVDREHDQLRDRAFRRFPAHLEVAKVVGEARDPWWGWRRIAWLPDDKRVPSHTYLQRREPSDDPYWVDRRWDDAT
jgi:transcriptional regulator with XRE-family HTH domain